MMKTTPRGDATLQGPASGEPQFGIASSRWIVHVDMDAFYAAVEQRDQPRYRGKPVIVGAHPQEGKGRGVVSTASYEARKFGVHSAMPISQAYKRCPQAIFLPVRMSWYQEVSSRIFSIFRRYTDLLEPLSLDEAFLDVTGSLRLFGTAEAIGGRIQRDIWEEEHLSASVGVAATKFVAKVASDLQKPKGFVVVAPGDEKAFLKNLPVERLWGAGPKTTKRLRARGYSTIGDIAALKPEEMTAVVGPSGLHLWELAQGLDHREVIPEEPPKSVGAETTFERDTADQTIIRQTLLELAERVGRRLRTEGVVARTLTLKFRDSRFHTLTRSAGVHPPTNQDAVLYRQALTLLERIPMSGQKARLVGLSGSKLSYAAPDAQLSLFDVGQPSGETLTSAVDAIRARYGEQAIQPATLLAKRSK